MVCLINVKKKNSFSPKIPIKDLPQNLCTLTIKKKKKKLDVAFLSVALVQKFSFSYKVTMLHLHSRLNKAFVSAHLAIMAHGLAGTWDASGEWRLAAC